MATLHSYTNWVQAVKISVFNEDRGVTKYDNYVPKYPQRIYDYHYLDRVLVCGEKISPKDVSDLRLWNKDVSNILKTLGPNKQANIVILITDLPRDFYYSVVKLWRHGKKNDVVIMIGLGKDQEIVWSEVCSWSKRDIFNVKLRDAAMELGKLDREKLIKTIYEVTMSDFQRRSMKEFEYLKKEIHISTGICVMFFILLIGCWIGLHFLGVKIQEDRPIQRRRMYR